MAAPVTARPRAYTDHMRAHEPWPELPWRDWEATITTLHMLVQIVDKVRCSERSNRRHPAKEMA